MDHPPRQMPSVAERPIPGLVGCAAYLDGHRLPNTEDPASALRSIRERGHGFVWVSMFEPDSEHFEHLAHIFGLHVLSVEDAIHAHQRPKLDQYRRYSVLVLKTVVYVEHSNPLDAAEIVQTGEILMFCGPDFIITVRHGEHTNLKSLRSQLEADPKHLAIGPAIVAHAVADLLVDHYVAVAQNLDEDIDEMELAVFAPDRPLSIEQIYKLKREVMELRRAVNPLQAPLRVLASGADPFVPQAAQAYFVDVDDHLSRVCDHIHACEELLASLAAAAMAAISVRQNEDMRKISAWAAIGLVPTAIAGIYGMNFDTIPGAHSPWGFVVCVLLMTMMCIVLAIGFRRKKWL